MASRHGNYAFNTESTGGNKRKRGNYSFTSNSSSSNNDVQKRIKNYKTRLKNIDDDKDVTDKRNWLEKALNLKKDQNALFDVFELLGRPQQALFGAIDAGQKGKNVFEGAKKGITGEKETSGGKLLRNAGMSGNGKFNLFDKKSYKNASASDFLGFAADMVLDPVDMALLGVTVATGGTAAPATIPAIAGKAAKGVKVANTASDVAKAAKLAKTAKVIDTASDVAKAVKAVDTASDVAKAARIASKVDNIYDVARAADTASDAAKAVKQESRFRRIITKGAKPTNIKIGKDKVLARQSLSQILMNTLGEGAKETGKFGDFLITSGKKFADSRTEIKAEKIASKLAKKGKKVDVDDIIKELGGTNRVEKWDDFKKAVKNVFQGNKKLTKMSQSVVEGENQAKLYRNQASQLLEDIDKQVRDYAPKFAKKANMKEDDAYKFIRETLLNNREYSDLLAKQNINGADFIKDLARNTRGKGKNIYEFAADEDSYNALKKFLGDYKNISYEVDDAAKTIRFNKKASKGWKDFITEASEKLNNVNLKKGSLGVDASVEDIYKRTRDLVNSDKTLSKLDKLHHNFYNEDTNRLIKEATGGEIVRPQAFQDNTTYTPKVITEEYANATGRQLGDGKKQGLLGAAEKKASKAVSSLQGNFDNYSNKAVKNIDREIKRVKKSLSLNATDDAVKSIAKREQQIQNTIKQSQKELNKMGIKTKKLQEDFAKIHNIQKDVGKKLSDDVVKKIDSAFDLGAKSKFAENLDKYNKLYKEYDKKLDKLLNGNLTEKQAKALNKEIETLGKTMEQASRDLDGVIAQTSGSLSKTEAKALDNIVKSEVNTIQNTKRADKITDRMLQEREATRVMKQAYNDTIERSNQILEQNKLKLRTVKRGEDKALLERISRLEKAKSTMETAGATQKYALDYFASADAFINKNANFIKASKIYGEAALTNTLLDPDFVKLGSQITDGKIPKGFVKLNGPSLADDLYRIQNFLPEGSDTVDYFKKMFKGEKVYVKDDLARMLGYLDSTSSGDVNALLKGVDKFNNIFKKFKTMTPGFHLRNWAGNNINAYLSGMPVHAIPVYKAKAIKVLNQSDDILKKIRLGTKLTPSESKTWDILQQFYQAGFKEVGTELQDLSSIVTKYSKSPINKAANLGVKANQGLDNLNRLSLLMYATDHPNYLKKLGKSTPVEAVRYALMDPTNISQFESKYMKRLIPFYTFTKQNLLFQATNIMQNTPRYHKVLKALDKTYDNLNENQYYDYQKNSMQLPVPFTDNNGNQMFLKTNLPLSDLGEFMSDPLRRTLSSTTPLLKTPVEMVTGKDIFTDRDLYFNTGNELSQSLTGKELEGNSKKWAARAEQVLSGLGIDTITTNNVKKISAVLKKHNGDMDSQAMWAEIFRSILQNNNQEKVEKNKAYQEMLDYQAYVKGLKDQGTEVPTIRDITAHNKTSLTRAKRRRSNRGNYSFN